MFFRIQAEIKGVKMTRNGIFTKFSNLLISFILLVFSISAQSDQGRIAGTITDANGSVVAGAAVTVTNDITGEMRTATTSSEGTFQIIALKPSSYTVAVSAANFESATRKNVAVLIGQA